MEEKLKFSNKLFTNSESVPTHLSKNFQRIIEKFLLISIPKNTQGSRYRKETALGERSSLPFIEN